MCKRIYEVGVNIFFVGTLCQHAAHAKVGNNEEKKVKYAS